MILSFLSLPSCPEATEPLLHRRSDLEARIHIEGRKRFAKHGHLLRTRDLAYSASV
jgi:hypothetical protein